MLETKQKRIRRHKRVRAKIIGKKDKPRLCVFCSNSHVYAQLIDDGKGEILASVNDLKLKKSPAGKQKDEGGSGKKGVAYQVGKLIAQEAAEKKIINVVFDRGGFKYHGVVKALAEGAREGGLKF